MKEKRMNNKNMELWNKVCKTDPGNTKDFKGKGGFSGTAICAQSQRKKATEMFGVFGIGWKLEDEQFNVLKIIDSDQKYDMMVYSATFVFNYSDTQGKIKIYSEIDIWTYSTKWEKWNKNNDIHKKLKTDALTKGLSELGFNSDVFEGKYDDNKYVNAMKEEFKGNEKPKTTAPQKKTTTAPQKKVSSKVQMLKDAVNGKEIVSDKDIHNQIRNTLQIILNEKMSVEYWKNKDAVEIIDTVKSKDGITKSYPKMTGPEKTNLVKSIQEKGKEVWDQIQFDRQADKKDLLETPPEDNIPM